MERRKFERLGGDFRVQIDIPEIDVDIKPETGKMDNISAAGLLIRHSKSFETGRIVELTFLSPHSFEVLKVNAKVVRVDANQDKSYDIGVEYINFMPEDEKLLDYFLTYGSHRR